MEGPIGPAYHVELDELKHVDCNTWQFNYHYLLLILLNVFGLIRWNLFLFTLKWKTSLGDS